MSKLIITITDINSGNDTLPCHFYPAETCDRIFFSSLPGLETETVSEALYSLFQDVCNVEYSPGDGTGVFISIDSSPLSGRYEYAHA